MRYTPVIHRSLDMFSLRYRQPTQCTLAQECWKMLIRVLQMIPEVLDPSLIFAENTPFRPTVRPKNFIFGKKDTTNGIHVS